ncbi:MAG TPA: pentapeptide repeat-containing protein, partial [Tepidisphaeraceae bacterium]|nr:pentapeptide repeat-containing protein [Tepidisphaeraceae bacterium]
MWVPATGSDIPAQPALVVPRARRSGESAALPIHRLIDPMLFTGVRGVVAITSPPGGGKTTALRHLRALLPPNVALFDEINLADAIASSRDQLAIYAGRDFSVYAHWLDVFELAPWTEDDCTEYLAAVHRDQCAATLDRLRKDRAVDYLEGCPALLVAVMDQMAADESLTSARNALRRAVRTGQSPWHRHKVLKLICAADAYAEKLADGVIPKSMERMGSRLLICEIAEAVRLRPKAVANLESLLRCDPRNPCAPMAASIMLGVDPTWRPAGSAHMNFAGAFLQSAKWSDIRLAWADFRGADLSGADLNHAILARADFSNATLTGANLQRARLMGASFSCAQMAAANLAGAVACEAAFDHAVLADANLTSAELSRASLYQAELENAALPYANLCNASLLNTQVSQADFTNANFNGAEFCDVDMNRALWTSASFCGVKLIACNLEGLDLSGADFTKADLTGSLFTGTRIRGGRFVGAILRETGLAEIEWDGSDLRDADFTHASFHLGSSRSGLVGSTIPCEGSRTGFYTDEFNEQDYKAPEEIRKASLCRCDLRGAKVEGTDFYLVDLRGAIYTQEQRQFFARCGA